MCDTHNSSGEPIRVCEDCYDEYHTDEDETEDDSEDAEMEEAV